jgi:hypothetical protein
LCAMQHHTATSRGHLAKVSTRVVLLAHSCGEKEETVYCVSVSVSKL